MNIDRTGPSPLASFACVAAFAFAATALLYGWLESSGVFKNEFFELGGAAAGFIAFLLIGHKSLISLIDRSDERSNLAQRNSELENRVRELEMAAIPNIECPDGYVAFSSRDHGVGFSRPNDWEPHEEAFLGIFKRPMDELVEKQKFQGNITITAFPYSIDRIPEHPLLNGSNENKLLKLPHLRAMRLLKVDPDSVFWEEGYIQNRSTLRTFYDYTNLESGNMMYTEALTLLNPSRKEILIFSLHEAKCRKEESSKIFKKVLSTISLWE